MKKMMDAIARRFRYMPISEAAATLEDAERAAARQRAARRLAELEYASTTTAAAERLVAVTARIPVVVK